MHMEKDLLLQSAARLYTLGVDLEGAREQLRKLTEEGVSYESEEMTRAYQNFIQLQEQWNTLEREYLALKNGILTRGRRKRKERM